MSEEEVIETVMVNGERRDAVETFTAARVRWVRYKLRGENYYATELEWNHWKAESTE